METTGTFGRAAGWVALAVGATGFGAAVLLIVFFVVGGRFGTANDVGNAVLGCLGAVLAWLLRVPARWSMLGLVAAVVGAGIMVVGSILIISDTTGYILAGLVSGLGAAFIGIWLLDFVRRTRSTGQLPGSLARLGVVAGAFMLLGLLSLPGIAARFDTDLSPPWHVTAAGVSWLGTYLLYPAWTLRLGRHLRRASASPAVNGRAGSRGSLWRRSGRE